MYNAFKTDTHNYTIIAAKEQFRINFDEIIGLYDKVDVDTLYSKTTPTTGDTYYEQAVKAINDSKDSLKAHFFAANGDVQNVDNSSATGIKGTEDILRNNIVLGPAGSPYGASQIGAVYYDGTTVVQYYYIVGIPTKDDEADDSATIAATTAAIKAQVAKNVAAFSKNNKSTSDKEFADDYAAFYNYLADNITMHLYCRRCKTCK